MRHAVFSDVHANPQALEAVLADIDAQGVDRVWCAGDSVGYGPYPNHVVDILRRRRIPSVKGNHDWCASSSTVAFNEEGLAREAMEVTLDLLTEENKYFLRSLPWEIVTDTLHIVHCCPKDDFEKGDDLESHVHHPWQVARFLDDVKAPILVIGHTHEPKIWDMYSVLVVNPGSVGWPRDFDTRASYAIIDDEEMTARIVRVRYDAAPVHAGILRMGLPKYLSVRLLWGT
jgi:putative phosphoesterase